MKKTFCDVCGKPITTTNPKFKVLIDNVKATNADKNTAYVEIEVILRNSDTYDICTDCVFDTIKKNDSRNNTRFSEVVK